MSHPQSTIIPDNSLQHAAVDAVLDERNENQRYQGVFTRNFKGFLKSREQGLKTFA